MHLILSFGDRRERVGSFAEASAVYGAARDASGLGGSEFPAGTIEQAGRIVAHLSYNGRVWARPPSRWRPGDRPLFDNREALAAGCPASGTLGELERRAGIGATHEERGAFWLPYAKFPDGLERGVAELRRRAALDAAPSSPLPSSPHGGEDGKAGRAAGEAMAAPGEGAL